MARRKGSTVEKSGAPEWMATYSDLVTLLLCFFAVLFSMSSIDAEKFKAVINSFNNSLDLYYNGQTIGDGSMLGNGINQLPDFEILFEKEANNNVSLDIQSEGLETQVKKMNEFITSNNLQEQVVVDYKDNYIKLSLIDNNILFDTGQAELKLEAKQILSVLSEQLSLYKDNVIKIEGHTDNVPIHTKQYPSNWYLSSARAISVAEYLINEKGFNPQLISADGRGEYSPIASNDTPEGRSKNRRVEIYIYFNIISTDETNKITDQ